MKNGDRSQAWSEFVDRYRDAIVSFCRDVLKLRQDNDYIAQTVLIKLLRVMATFEYNPNCCFRAYIKKATRNVVFDYFRSELGRPDRAVGDTAVRNAVTNAPDRSQLEEFTDHLSIDIRRSLFNEAKLRVKPRLRNANSWLAYSSAAEEGRKAL